MTTIGIMLGCISHTAGIVEGMTMVEKRKDKEIGNALIELRVKSLDNHIPISGGMKQSALSKQVGSQAEKWQRCLS